MNKSTTATVTLTVDEDGILCTPHDAIVDKGHELAFYLDGKPRDPGLMVAYPSGDYDVIKWPNPETDNLRSALYDAREMGLIPDVGEVVLPDGATFTIDG